MKNYDAFIFDIDGTLANTNELIFASFNHVAEKYLNKNLTDEEIVKLFGPTEDVILQQWMKEQYENARKDYFDFYDTQHKLLADIYPGIKDILTKLKDAGKKLAVFTGKGKDTSVTTLKKIDVYDYFDTIVTGDDVDDHKPSPEGILKVLNELDIEKDKTIMIGDALSDIKASHDAGVDVAAVVWGSYKKEEVIESQHDYLFHTIEEFEKFVDEVLSA